MIHSCDTTTYLTKFIFEFFNSYNIVNCLNINILSTCILSNLFIDNFDEKPFKKFQFVNFQLENKKYFWWIDYS